MDKKPIKATVNSIVVLLIAFTAITPFLVVLNLTPETRQPIRPNVLGVQSSIAGDKTISLIEGVHNYITDESLVKRAENVHVYSAQINARESGTYSKPIVNVTNTSSKAKKLKVFSSSDTPGTSTKVGIIINGTNYILEDNGQTTLFHQLSFDPNSDKKIYLSIESPLNISYDELITITFIEISESDEIR